MYRCQPAIDLQRECYLTVYRYDGAISNLYSFLQLAQSMSHWSSRSGAEITSGRAGVDQRQLRSPLYADEEKMSFVRH